MFSLLRLPLLGLIVILSGTAAFAEVQEIKPPFGIYWGLGQEGLNKALQQAAAHVVEKKTVNGREVWVVEGIVNPKLLRTLFYFEQGQLTEVELQYGEESWDGAGYNNYFESMRRALERRYGAGKMVTKSRNQHGDVQTSLVGYQWTQPGCSLQIFYFSAERGAEAHRLISMHYRAL